MVCELSVFFLFCICASYFAVAPSPSRMSLDVINFDTPVIPSDPPICLFFPGKEYVFQCVVKSTKPVADVAWTFNGVEQAAAGVITVEEDGLESVQTSLSKILTTEIHSGTEMSCVARNSASDEVGGDALVTLMLQDISKN